MEHSGKGSVARRFAADYGMLFVLLLLCAIFTGVTVQEQRPVGAEAGKMVAKAASLEFRDSPVLIVAGTGVADTQFAEAAQKELTGRGFKNFEALQGAPSDLRERLIASVSKERIALLLCSSTAASWSVVQQAETLSGNSEVKILQPTPHTWPNFLKRDNLLNIASQISVIAIVAIGMSFVIITGGIDLSVGSLIALSAVICTLCIRELFGGAEAGTIGLLLAGALAMAGCALAGLASGGSVVLFGIPPFIATLAMMLVANGAAFLMAKGESIYQLPEAFVWLGRGATLGFPNSVLLTVALYIVAHVFMKRHAAGRYMYAIGGNPMAARYSGVPVKRILLLAYLLSGALAGLGGVVMASQLKSGSPTYGQMYELYVIAAVVVGGASLSGGQGKIFGTLIGALIIAVIQNGMNLTGIESYTQKVVLGLVILAAVLLDALKRRGLRARPAGGG